MSSERTFNNIEPNSSFGNVHLTSSKNFVKGGKEDSTSIKEEEGPASVRRVEGSVSIKEEECSASDDGDGSIAGDNESESASDYEDEAPTGNGNDLRKSRLRDNIDIDEDVLLHFLLSISSP
ncbi:hypothetical protein DFQ26_007976 [Actinomortierella ambigua]|nr:hypothetical protein DFQ26_007976 [Actinomortierella ambigua]